jgi:hypothetical protein
MRGDYTFFVCRNPRIEFGFGRLTDVERLSCPPAACRFSELSCFEEIDGVSPGIAISVNGESGSTSFSDVALVRCHSASAASLQSVNDLTFHGVFSQSRILGDMG